MLPRLVIIEFSRVNVFLIVFVVLPFLTTNMTKQQTKKLKFSYDFLSRFCCLVAYRLCEESSDI